MAVANIVAKGVGFSPQTVYWLFTHGFAAPLVVPPESGLFVVFQREASQVSMRRLPSLVTLRRDANG